MKRTRLPRTRLVALTIAAGLTGALLLAWALFPDLDAAAEAGLRPSLVDWLEQAPANAAQAAWHRVLEAGSYQFSADVRQQTIPIASGATIGQVAREDTLYMEGQADLRAEILTVKLWADGGNLLDTSKAYELKAANGRTYTRPEGGQWSEVGEWLQSMAPQGDFLGFLAAADEVRALGPETSGSTTYERYSFQINGPRLADLLRQQLEESLRQQGELPPGVSLDPSTLIRGATGRGELWVGRDGLPMRQTIELDFPPDGEEWRRSTITVRLSGFGQVALARPAPLSHVAPVLRQFAIGLLAVVAALALAVLSPRLGRQVYRWFSLFVIAAMVAGPLLQNDQVAAYYERESARRTRIDGQMEAAGATQDLTAAQAEAAARQLARGGPAALAAIRTDDGTDRDADGLTDVQERFLETNPLRPDAGPILTNAAIYLEENGTDSDQDGLTDYQESLLGTYPDDSDSDGDLISDYAEVQGFSWNGRIWYSDPLELDTNRDSVDDSREWNSPERHHPTWDTDNDGTPDLFDTDNDDDGVPDKLDLSPFGHSDSVFNQDQPFNLLLAGLQSGAPTFVEFQLRPSDPEHLWYALNTLDWPFDDKGNVKDITGGTFAGSDGDLQLVPMLEIQITDAPSNLPLTTTHSAVTIRPILPAEPIAVVSGTVHLAQVGQDVELTFSGFRSGSTYYELPLQIREGTCGDPGEIVIDGLSTFPLTQTLTNQDLTDWTDGNHVFTWWQWDPRNVVGCGQFANQPYEPTPVDGYTMIDTDKLAPYRLSVRDGSPDHSGKVVYVPLNLVTDQDSGARVAFQGQMLYDPHQPWSDPHQVRFVWFVSMLNDRVCQYGYGAPSMVPQGGDPCQEYADDVPQVLHVYDDNWLLTGLDIREERGADLALLWESPAADQNHLDDGGLIRVADALESSFAAGRDCSPGDTGVQCQPDLQRDVTVAEVVRRMEPATLQAVWGITNTMVAERHLFDTLDAMVYGLSELYLDPVLNSFRPYWTASRPITPSLLLAYEHTYRALNLDGQAIDDTFTWSGSDRLTVDFAGGGGVRTRTDAHLKLSPYQFLSGENAWRRLEAQEWWDEIEQRYANDVEESDPEVAGGMLTAIQLYLYALYSGTSRVVQFGDEILDADSAVDAAIAARTYASYGLKVAKFIIYQVFVGRYLVLWSGGPRSFWLYLFTGFRETFRSALTVIKKIGNAARTLIEKFRAIKSLRVQGSIILVITALVVALITFIVYFATLPNAGKISLKLLLVVVSLVLGVILPAKTALTFIRAAMSSAAAARGALMSASAALKATVILSIVALVLELGVIWGFFIYYLASGKISAGSPEYYALLAYSIASTLVTLIMTAIALIPFVGAIIVGLIGLVDAILSLLCEIGVESLVDEEGQCFSVVGGFTEALAKAMYGSGIIFDFEQSFDDYFGQPDLLHYDDVVKMEDFAMGLIDPQLGLIEGNTAVFTASLYMNLYPSVPSHCASSAYAPSNIRTTGILYELGTSPEVLTATRSNSTWGDWQFEHWMDLSYRVDGFPCTVGVYHGTSPQQERQSPAIPLVAGINRPVELYLNLGLALPGWTWILSFTKDWTHYANSQQSLGEGSIYLDILPDSVTGFWSLNWAESEMRWNQRDHDGDGVLSTAHGGPDQNDEDWDTDDDGFSDGYEFWVQGLPADQGGMVLSAAGGDTDGDGLCDQQELQWGSRSDRGDTDQDGLKDWEEVYHQDLCDGDHDGDRTEWVGGWLFAYGPGQSVRINSDPAEADLDGDGMTDRVEKLLHEYDPVTFPFHPRVRNESPLAMTYAINDDDGYVASGAGLVYTATVMNDLSVATYLEGQLTARFPAALGGGSTATSFSIFQSERAHLTQALTAAGGSLTAGIENELSASLIPGAQGGGSGLLLPTLTDTYSLTVDADLPTTTFILTNGTYLPAGLPRVVGGFAGDPTSDVTGVGISLDGGASYTETQSGPGMWSFTWEVPDSEGAWTLRVRATDVVGHVQQPPSTAMVVLDGTPPAASTTMTGNPVLRAWLNNDLRWAVPLTGTVADPAAGGLPGSGVERVEATVQKQGTLSDGTLAGWQTAVLQGSDWFIYYALPPFNRADGLMVDPTGAYTVTVRAIDKVGNVTHPADYLVFNVRLDNTAPTVRLDPINTDIQMVSDTLSLITVTTTISDRLRLTGAIDDAGDYPTGVAGVEVAFVPAEMLDALTRPSVLMYLNEVPGETVFRDQSGLNHPVTCDPAAGTCPSPGATGVYGAAARFDGGQVLDIEANVPESEVTWALWFNTTCADCGLASAYSPTGHDRDLYLSGGNVCAMVWGGFPDVYCTTGEDYADGAWHQATLVLGAAGSVLYVDGEPRAWGNLTTSTLAQLGLRLGVAPDAPVDYLVGRLDEFAVYGAAFNADQVGALFRRWRPATLVAAGPGVISTTWSYTLDDDLEGYYQIDLRGQDAVGNRNDEQRGRWAKWRGQIDTRSPSVSLQITYTGAGPAAQTHYQVIATDFSLVDDEFASPCSLEAGDYHDLDTAWWQSFGGGTSRLYQLSPSCTANGFQTDAVYARACDAFGRCTAAVPDQYLVYFVSYPSFDGIWDDNRIERASLFGGGGREIVVDNLRRVSGIDLDPLHGYLYWLEVDGRDGRIRRADLEGHNLQDVLTGLDIAPPMPRTGGLILNPPGGKMYWSQGNLIRWANLDGSGAATLYALPDEVYAGEIAIDFSHGKLYWIATDATWPYSNNQIWWADLDGSDAAPILDTTATTLFELTDLALDVTGGSLYWIDDATLWRADLNGTNKTSLGINTYGDKRVESLLTGPMGDQLIYNNLYHILRYGLPSGPQTTLIPSVWAPAPDQRSWMFWGTGPMALGRIPGRTFTGTDLAISKAAFSGLAQLGHTYDYRLTIRNQGLLNATGVVLTDDLPAGVDLVSSLPPAAGCSENAGRVICEIGSLGAGEELSLTLQVHVTAGASGTLVNRAGVTCEEEELDPSNNQVVLEKGLVVPPPTPTPVSPDTGRYLYWSDWANVWRLRLDVADQAERIVSVGWGSGVPLAGVGVDSVNHRLYWSEEGTSRIRRANLDGSDVETFLDTADRPRHIVPDPQQGVIYWTGVGADTQGAIYTANLDGTGASVLIPDIADPKALALNPLLGYLYWTDGTGTLRRANRDGGGIILIARGIFPLYLAVDVYGEHVYWIDPAQSNIQRAAPNGAQVETLPRSLGWPYKGLAIDPAGNRLYWAEGQSLFRANLDGGDTQLVQAGLDGIGSGGLSTAMVQAYAQPPPTPTPIPEGWAVYRWATSGGWPLDEDINLFALDVPEPGSVTEVKVRLRMDAPAPDPGLPLEVYLWSPDRTVIVLHRSTSSTSYGTGSTHGCSGNCTEFDDSAALPIGAGTSPFVGSFRSEGSLASLVGHNAAGRWYLAVRSHGSGASFWVWELEITRDPHTTPTPSSTPTPTPPWVPAATPTPGGPPPAELIYWSGWSASQPSAIYRSPLYCYQSSCITAFEPGAATPPKSLVIDSLHGKMVWFTVDVLPVEIKRANLDGSGVETVVTVPTSLPNALALDPDAEHLYWTVDDGRIQRADLDGSNQVTLVTAAGRPTWIALDPAGDRLFWVDAANAPTMRLMQANLAGGDVVVLLDEPGDNRPPLIGREVYGLAVDPIHDWLFWADRDYYLELYPYGRVQRLDLACTPSESCLRTMVESPERLPRGIALDLNAYLLFWGSETSGADTYEIRQRLLDGTGPTFYALSYPLTGGVEQLALQHASPTPTPTPSPTPSETPTASYTPTPTHTPSPSDTPTPTPTPTPSHTPTPSTTPQPLPSVTPGGPPPAEAIYWGIGSEIQRAPITGCLDGSCISTAITQVVSMAPVLVVDSVHGIVVWADQDPTDPSVTVINRANLDGSGFETILTAPLDVTGLDVDPENSHLYWSGGTPAGGGAIWRCSLDGSAAITITSGIDGPGQLAIDMSEDKLYWFDVGSFPRKRIMRSDLTGGSLEIVLQETDSTVMNPLIGQWVTGLALDEDHDWLYWTEHGDSPMYEPARVRRAALGCAGGLPLDPLCLRTMVEDPWTLMYGIDLDLTSLLMYWGARTMFLESHWIQRTQLDGTGVVSDVVGSISDRFVDVGLQFPSPTSTPTATETPSPTPTASHTPTPTDTSTPTPTDTATPTWTPLPVDTATNTPTPSTTATPSQTPTPSHTPTPTPTPTCEPGPDGYEPDDSAGEATELTTGGPSADHTFHVASDEDWLYLDAERGYLYRLYTQILAPDTDTYLELFDSDGTTLLAANDDTAGEPYSSIFFEPTADGRYYLRLTNAAGLGTCDTTYTVLAVGAVPTPLPTAQPQPVDYHPPLLSSAVLTPSHESVIDALGPISVAGAAAGLDFLRALTLTVDGAPLYLAVWPSGTLTETTWSTTWNPGLEGVYTLLPVASDWAGRVQTQTFPVQVIVDAGPPSIVISPTVYTSTHLNEAGMLGLTGITTDSLGIARVQVSVSGLRWSAAHRTGSDWRYNWFADALDGVPIPVRARALDLANRIAQAEATVLVDIVPPAPVTVSLFHQDGSTSVPLAPARTVAQANATLVISWTASSDGSGLLGYYAGWTESPTATLAELSFVPAAGPLQLNHVAGEAQVLYAHVVAIDALGNRRWQTVGPVYVDGPATPDLIAFAPSGAESSPYHGWMESGATQLSADRQISQGPFASAPFGRVQALYVSWDDQALRLAWTGADWDSAGDLFVYLDTTPGGATVLLNPYTSTAAIGFPAGMAPDWVVMLEDSATATLWAWDSGRYTLTSALDPSQFLLDRTTVPPITDLYLPFALLGLSDTTQLGLLAVASEEKALELWAAAPDHNPLNSQRVINPLARGRDLSAFDLTLAYRWPVLGPGVRPNEGRFVDSDLRVAIRPSPDALAVGYLDSDLLDLLDPAVRLDADGDGIIDPSLPIGRGYSPVYLGQVVTFAVEYANTGPMTATDLVVSAQAFDALALPGGASRLAIHLGDVAPGASGSHVFTATVVAAASRLGELDATVADGTHGVYDWLWLVDHLDDEPPVDLEIVAPVDFVRPLTQAVHGIARDISGVPSVTLQVAASVEALDQTIFCPQSEPFDDAWSCTWNAGDLPGLAQVQLRARAADSLGNVSGWTDWLTLMVDPNPPTVTLDADVALALADGFVNAHEAILSGQVVDDRRATAVSICQPPYGCGTRAVEPGTQPAGTWSYLVGVEGLDGVTQTLGLRGQDAVGNLSRPLTVTYRVDSVPPLITATLLYSQVLLSDYISGSISGGPVLTGTVSDGGGVAAVYGVLFGPDGRVAVQPGVLDGSRWSFSPLLETAGVYRLRIEAYDEAGNGRSAGSFPLAVRAVAGLAIGKLAPAGPHSSLEPLTYTLVIINYGPSVASGVVVTDRLPDGAQAIEIAAPAGSSCSLSPTLSCLLPPISPSLSVSLALTLDVSQTAPGMVVNRARVRAAEIDLDWDDNYDEAATWVEEPIAGLTATSNSPTVLGYPTWLSASLAAGSHVSYAWALGDGATIAGAAASHVYPAGGMYQASVTATNLLGAAQASTWVTVLTPTVSFAAPAYSVMENAGSALITVTLSAVPALTATVAYSSADGSATAGEDYEPICGTLIFAPGMDSRVLTVPIVSDSRPEPEETVILSLAGPTMAALADPTTATLTIADPYRATYLPLVLNQFLYAPDLVVTTLTATTDDVWLVVANEGTGPVVDSFWVDVYINPDPPPTAVNQTWNQLASQGLVWGVDDLALPLLPGRALTLTVGDAFYEPGWSSFSGTIPAGTPIYAQVDSANAGTAYGGVLENHEITGGPYNNIAGPVIARPAQRLAGLTGFAGSRPSAEGLPLWTFGRNDVPSLWIRVLLRHSQLATRDG